MEVEAKYRLAKGQREAVALKLGEPAQVLHQCDRYFNVPGRVLRFREENGATYLTRKDAATFTPEGVKMRHEVEAPISVDSRLILEDLLPWLGHDRLTEVRKERWQYNRDGFTIGLDRLEGLDAPDFLEIELHGGDLEGLGHLIEGLGIDARQIEMRSYARILAEESR